ncbi:UDP-N-acetylglucosamine-peptide N-acetylglucosaminyltransferase, partial [Duganella sp. FT134W]|nr:UDP-N-acetylglucosamine-peptide N-acetylglucosaminyltransferase [Duganella margarita]
AGLLLRREQLGAVFGHYQGRRYRLLAGVATALAALAGHDCAYLPAALSRYEPVVAAPAAPPVSPGDTIDLALEHLYLLYEAHTRTHFFSDTAQFKSLLSRRLGVLSTLTLEQHALLAVDAARSQQVQQALQQGYALLLS